jgi:hypothetical protein
MTQTINNWSRQTQLDHERILRMITTTLGYSEMARRLGPYARAALFSGAQEYCTSIGIPGPNRLYVRSREALICFFCDNTPNFPAGFPPIPRCSKQLPRTLNSTNPLLLHTPEQRESTDLQPVLPLAEVVDDGSNSIELDWITDPAPESEDFLFDDLTN